jgi:hypothetical protein
MGVARPKRLFILAGMWQGEQLAAVIMPTPQENARLQHLAATGSAKRLILAINPRWTPVDAPGATEAVFSFTRHDLPHLQLSVIRAYPHPWKVYAAPRGGTPALLATSVARPSLFDLVTLLTAQPQTSHLSLSRATPCHAWEDAGPTIADGGGVTSQSCNLEAMHVRSGHGGITSQSCDLEAMHEGGHGGVKSQSCNLVAAQTCGGENESPEWARELLAAASEMDTPVRVPPLQPWNNAYGGHSFSSAPDLTKLGVLSGSGERVFAEPSLMRPESVGQLSRGHGEDIVLRGSDIVHESDERWDIW